MKIKFLFVILLSSFLFSQSKPDIVVFDEADAGILNESFANVVLPSVLTVGGLKDKVLVVQTQSYTGIASALIEWKSVPTGNWHIYIPNPGWAKKNINDYDSVVLFVNARASINAIHLPNIGLESESNVGNKLSSLVNMGTYLNAGIDADSTSWQRLSIPIKAFQPYNGFDSAYFKDVNFHQAVTDNVQHTMWVDNIRVISKERPVDDTTKPRAPQKITARVGDKTMTLHWNRNTEPNLSGYNVYRSTSKNGSYSKMNTSVLSTQSYFDVNIVNDQSYYFFVRAVNLIQQESIGSDTITITAKIFASNADFLEYIQQTSFDYFWYEANPTNGLIKDRSTKASPASVASVGFGLTAIGIGVDRGFITRAEGRDRTLTTIKTFWNGTQGPDPTGIIGYKGWFYHFLDMNSATRDGNTELSSIDTGLLLAGMLYSKQYFNGIDSSETQIRALTDSIIARVDWNWMRNSGLSLTMGWYPGTGFIGSRWIGYNEAMILYIIGIGATVNPLSSSSWNEWTTGYQWTYSSRLGDSFVNFPPLFGHQYSHCWVDFRNVADTFMKGKGITYFENSRRATLDQRLYCIENIKRFVGYNPNMWGITASDVPTGYNARGTDMNDDGTLNPTAPGGSLPFTPEFSIPALRNMYDTHRTKIWTGYGFTDAFNETVNWWGRDVLGIDQGPIIIMAENYRTGNVWKLFMKEKIIIDGLQKAGFSTVTDVVSPENNIPSHYSLSQNYPNPFNPATVISYQLPALSFVSLKIFDVLGREITTLVNEQKPAGKYFVKFTASQFSSGIYFYKLTAGNFTETRIMIFAR